MPDVTERGGAGSPRRANAARCVVVVVTHNSEMHVAGLLDSLALAAGDVQTRVVVVDNASRDGTADVVRRYTDVEWVPTGANLGYAGGINVGRRRALTGESVLVLNPDMRLRPGCIERLHAAVEDPSVGVAVPKILDGRGLLRSLRREPSTLRTLGDVLLGGRFPRRPAALGEMVLDASEYATGHDVDWATGAAFMVSAHCDREVGAWDERFFLYSEEVDYAARVRSAGFRVRFVPEAVAEHDGGGSGSPVPLAALSAVSRVRYHRKHHGPLAALATRAVLALGCLLRARRPEQREALGVLLRKSRWSALDPRRGASPAVETVGAAPP